MAHDRTDWRGRRRRRRMWRQQYRRRTVERSEWIRLRCPVKVAERPGEPVEMMFAAVVVATDHTFVWASAIRRSSSWIAC